MTIQDSIHGPFHDFRKYHRQDIIVKPKGPTIVCLCGSGRFRDAFAEAEYRETLKGKIVLTIGCNTHDIAREDELKHHKPLLDELHLRKIDLADEILVLNIDGYIGDSTRSEIKYAEKHGKLVRYLEPPPNCLEGEGAVNLGPI